MTREEAFIRIKTDLVEIFEIEPEKIVPEATLMDDLELDSIDGVDMMVHLQELTGKKVAPEQFESVKTIDDLTGLVKTLYE
ncbi:acyl carrier protein [Henriciella sp.]|uniref:acyl carrier protein n=1 Tax=Henriciella sp. TaxID=1968823 RepID=UPI00262E1746|nr:acyl carrier protein [Henriciella sp.]